MRQDNSSSAGLPTDINMGYTKVSPQRRQHSFPEPRGEGIQLHTLPSIAAFPLQKGGFPELKADLPEG